MCLVISERAWTRIDARSAAKLPDTLPAVAAAMATNGQECARLGAKNHGRIGHARGHKRASGVGREYQDLLDPKAFAVGRTLVLDEALPLVKAIQQRRDHDTHAQERDQPEGPELHAAKPCVCVCVCVLQCVCATNAPHTRYKR